MRQSWAVPVIRVFGGKLPSEESRREGFEFITGALRDILNNLQIAYS